LVYLPYSAGSYNFTAAAEPNPKAGGGAHGLGQTKGMTLKTPQPVWGGEGVGRGGLQARDPKTNTIKWVKPGRGGATSGGTVTTATNLLIQPLNGNLYVYKADTGDEILALPVTGNGVSPITYMAGNEQYIGFPAGSNFLAFKLGGTAAMPPAPAGGGKGGPGGFGGGKGKGGPPPPPAPPKAEPQGELHGADQK
jgi:hypothetical protein